MSELKRIVVANGLAANRSAVLHPTAPRTTVEREAWDRIENNHSACHWILAGIDSKRLIGFGLPLANTDSKELLGFGEFVAYSTSHLFYASCKESPQGKT